MFCLDVGQSGTVQWNGSTWSAATEGPPGPIVSQIDCPTPSLCAAASTDGDLSVWSNGAWSASTQIEAPTSTTSPVVSCTSATWCMALETDGHAALWSGDSWSADSSLDLAGATFLSCPTVDWCAAALHNGTVATWDGTTWSPSEGVDRPQAVFSGLSCTPGPFCMLTDDSNALVLGSTAAAGSNASPTTSVPHRAPSAVRPMAKGTWSKPVPMYPRPDQNTLVGISCSTSAACLAVYNGQTCQTQGPPEKHFCVGDSGPASSVVSDTVSWSRPIPVTGAPTAQALSCAVSGWCALVTTDSASSYMDGKWGSGTALQLPPGAMANAVSCPATRFCVAVDDMGDAVTFDGERSTESSLIDLRGSLTSVSCASTRACVAVDDGGRAVVWDGQAWSTPQPIDPGVALSAVACPAADDCVAIDADGRVLYWRGGGWSSALRARPGIVLTALSCPAVGGCTALDRSGQVLMSDGTSWSAPKTVDRSGRLIALSCASTRACVAADNAGKSVKFLAASHR